MVKRFVAFIGKEVKGLHQAAIMLALFSLLSQVVGLMRDRLLAHTFGAGSVLDLYYAAFRVPDFIFASVASLVSVSVLIPLLASASSSASAAHKKGNSGSALVDRLFSVFFLLLIVVCGVAYFLMPSIAPKLFPGVYDVDVLITMARILLLSPLLLGLSNFLASITQLHGRFILYGIAPILYNVGIVVGIVFLYPTLGVYGLAWGVALGAFLHLIVQVPWIVMRGFAPRPTLLATKDWREVGKVFAVSLPRTLALSMTQLAGIFLVALASKMEEGSISIFNLSFNLQSVPIAIIGASYSVAAFPILSKLHAGGAKQEFMHRMENAARHIVFWSLPMIALFIVLRAQIVRVVLGASSLFSWSDTRLTAAALAIFVVSLVPQCLNLLFVRAFYAQGKTVVPFIVNLFAAGCIAGIAWFFTSASAFWAPWATSAKVFLRVGNLPSGVLLLAIAYTCGMIISLIFHWALFRFYNGGFGKMFWVATLQSMIAALLLGFVAYYMLDIFDDIFGLTTTLGVFLQGFCAGVLGIVAALMLLYILGNKEVRVVGSALYLKMRTRRSMKGDTLNTKNALNAGGINAQDTVADTATSSVVADAGEGRI